MKNILNDLSTLFDEAKQRVEFEFVMTLINYRGMGKEDVTNLYEWFDAIEMYKKFYLEFSGKEKTRIGTLLYSTFFENSDFYNIIGSLCKVKLGYKGSSYLYYKTKKYERLLGTGEKIELILELLADCKKEHIIQFFQENHFKEIRNTFFHSAYSLIDDEYILQDSEAIIIDRIGLYSFNVNTFLYPKINNIIAFFDEFKRLYNGAFLSYQEDKEVFALFPGPTTATIFGSVKGIKGVEIKNTASFYGVMAHSGIYYDDNYDMWMAKNIRFDFPQKETIEIGDELSRYESKENISRSNAEFQNLIDRIKERNRPEEIERATAILLKYGSARDQQMAEEQNQHKKKSLYPGILYYYKLALEIGNAYIKVDELTKRIKELEV
ncbi:hypothetical protein HDF24_06795 [Mucilaginibacter sp. X4EP1]|uniref:hypothetical protein n=1 Tax=Mucilaginibacter sp. X4EP1 TaxID=2723092 RepID=UPI0021693159|nr:hypothetical protein [Mucilaginibacter sp. X4EP1]MCS3814014.1 hypothetical protein [Mucilaginibacter sp. X4EP1]